MPATDVSNYNSIVSTKSFHHSNFNLPNSLTVFRILLIPVFMYVFLSPSWHSSFLPVLVFSLAALTDFLDGYLARRHNQVTDLGRLLDPIADKLLIISGLILLVQFQRIEAWLAVAIIAREVAVSGLRAIAAAEGLIISSDTMGKYKACLQIFGIICLALPHNPIYLQYDFYELGTMTLYAALALGIFSGFQYCMRAFQTISPRFSQNHQT